MARRLLIALLFCLSLGVSAAAQTPPPPETRTPASLVYLDPEGVIRWRRNNAEVRLFGANYCAFSGQDYRMAGRVAPTARR